MSNSVMCHVVAGYPNFEDCLKLMQGMDREGVVALEVQIPFTDPIADGDAIARANEVALKNGMTIDRTFELIKQARDAGVRTDLYIMSYLQKVRHLGFEELCKRAAECSMKGFILPDLPYDTPEYAELEKQMAKYGLENMYVLTPNMPDERLKAVLAKNPTTLYVTSTQGITGNPYAPAGKLSQLVEEVRKNSKARVMIGFGINTPDDVKQVLEIADVAIVGSAVIKKTRDEGVEGALALVRSLVNGS